MLFGAIQSNPQSLIRLWTKPVTIRKDNLNRDLIIKQHWVAASDQVETNTHRIVTRKSR